jgi:hypothetical protein
MNLFRWGGMIPNLDEEGVRVLDDEDRGRINNLLEKRKNNVMRRGVRLLFLQTEEVEGEPKLASKARDFLLLENCSKED